MKALIRKWRIFLNARLLILVCALSFSLPIKALQIDIGIHVSANPNRMDIKIRPDFQINANQTIGNIIYTVRWVDPGTAVTTIAVAPYNVVKWGTPILSNGFYYQRFYAFPTQPVGTAILPGQERLIAAFTYSGTSNPYFEIIKNHWTQNNYGNPYIELQGFDRTGIIYQPYAPLMTLTLQCPPNISKVNDPGICGAVVNYSNPIYNNPGATLTQTSGLPSGSVFPPGTTLNTFVATDPMNISVSCSFQVTVQDIEAPMLPDNIITTVECISATLNPPAPLGSDNCNAEIPPVLFSMVDIPNPLTCQGQRVYTFLYSDPSANVSYWSITYNIVRTTPPAEQGGPVPTSGIVNCISLAVHPQNLPLIADACGEILQPANIQINDTYNGCSGSRTYTYYYLDCANQLFEWTYTYQILPSAGPQLVNPGVGCTSLNQAGINNVKAFGLNLNTAALTAQVAGLYSDNCGEPVTVQWTETIAGNQNTDLQWSFEYIFLITDRCGNSVTCSVTYSGGLLPYEDRCDIAITESIAPNKIDIKIRPEFLIEGTHAFSNIVFTIRWVDPATEVTVITFPPYNIEKWGEAVFSNGFYYQKFQATPNQPVGTDILAGQERLVASFTYSGSVNPYFELIVNDWTEANAGNPYLELQGYDVTGIIYQTYAPLIELFLECPPGISTGNDVGVCGAIVSFSLPFVNNPGASLIQTDGLPNGSFLATGTITNVFEATDPMGVTVSCVFTITVADNEAPSVPENESITIECISGIVEPVPPMGSDNCSAEIYPELHDVQNLPDPLTCEGQRIYTFSYTDAAGNVNYWTYTYNIQRITPPNEIGGPVPTFGGTIACFSEAVFPSILPLVVDACGEILEPAEIIADDFFGICSGTFTYKFIYNDCANQIFEWFYTYQVLPSSGPQLTNPETGCASLNQSGIVNGQSFGLNYNTSLLSGQIEALYADNCGEPISVQWIETIPGTENSDFQWSFDYYFLISDRCGISTQCFVTFGGGAVPEERLLDEMQVLSGQIVCYSAVQTIITQDLTVFNQGSLTLIAGNNIILLPGTVVKQGAYFSAQIHNDYCFQPPSLMTETLEPEIYAPRVYSAERKEKQFRVYPNPVSSILHLELTKPGETDGVSLEVYSLMGNLLLSIQAPAQPLHELNLSNLPKGVYLIRVVLEGESNFEKVVKQ